MSEKESLEELTNTILRFKPGEASLGKMGRR